KTDTCWEWTASTYGGYGRFFVRTPSGGGRPRTPHRLVYEAVHGELPHDGWHVHHLCENKSCCNPAHLEAVSVHEHLTRDHDYQTRDITASRYIRAEALERTTDFKAWRKGLIRRVWKNKHLTA